MHATGRPRDARDVRETTTAVPSDPALAAEARVAAARLGEGAAIAFSVDGERLTYRVAGEALVLERGADAPIVVAMSRAAWDDVTGQVRTFVNLYLSGELVFERGGFDHLAHWDPALKLVHAGIPLYDPDRTDLSDLDPAASFAPDARDDELRAFLSRVGYLHVRGVFAADEVAAMNAAVDDLAAAAREGDDRSWWVTAEGDGKELCRLVYATQRSEVLRRCERDPRVVRLGRLLRDDVRPCTDRMEGTSVLLKVPGRTEGLSNIPWHQDCGMGGHSFMCPAVAVGVQLTGSSAETGHFAAVPGSHGQTLPYRWEDRLDDVPIVTLDTEPGDVTVHVQDLMHASPPPTGRGGRRTMYVAFSPPALWDHIGPGEAFNDLVRNRQEETASLQG